VFDQWGELPLLPFGNPIGFVPPQEAGFTLNTYRKIISSIPRCHYWFSIFQFAACILHCPIGAIHKCDHHLFDGKKKAPKGAFRQRTQS
jgi:hypothetical protein